MLPCHKHHLMSGTAILDCWAVQVVSHSTVDKYLQCSGQMAANSRARESVGGCQDPDLGACKIASRLLQVSWGAL